jgi:hypothetical protein
MPGPMHSWLYVQDTSGLAYEVINGARTFGYLANPALAINGLSACQSFGTCATYPFKPYLGQTIPGYVTIPNVNSNYLSTPDAAALDIVGDLTIVAKVAPTSWAAGGFQTIVGKWSTASNLSYLFSINSASGLTFQWTTGGITPLSLASSVAIPGIVAGQAKWVAVTFDVDNGAAGRTARFWWSNNGINWNLIGTPQTSATATSIFSGTSPLFLGVNTATTERMNGNIYDVSIRTGFDPTTFAPVVIPGAAEKFHFSGYELTNAAAATFVATSGQTVTVNKSGSPQTTITPVQACGSWSAQTYSTPALDPAPWYNVAYPQSADALGMLVEDWTGLDDAHITRPTTPWGGYGGGASLGSIAATGRTMKVNLFLFGRTEEAVEYLFRWLAATLTGVCATCATESMLVRRYCGSTSNLWDGVAEIRQVGLIEGLKWEAEPFTGGSCTFRRASFTLMAGDPCMYSQEITPTPDGSDINANLVTCLGTDSPTNELRAICRPLCTEVAQSCRTTRAFTVSSLGVTGPIVTWSNNQNQYSYPMRAVVRADPGTVGIAPNPCGLPILGEIYVRALPPYAQLRWDVVGRTVEVIDSTTGGWAPGWAYIDGNDPPIGRFFAAGCGKAYVIMEPATLCADFISGTTWTLDGLTFNPPAYPSVSLAVGERLSCP